jgi:hypothetical protein
MFKHRKAPSDQKTIQSDSSTLTTLLQSVNHASIHSGSPPSFEQVTTAEVMQLMGRLCHGQQPSTNGESRYRPDVSMSCGWPIWKAIMSWAGTNASSQLE